MMNRIAISAALLAGVMSAQAVVTGTISGMTTFGDNGTGWMSQTPVAPGFINTGTTTRNTRGIAYGNGNVYVATREGGNAVHILNATTGQKIGNLNMTGVSGGAVVLTQIRTDADGRIYLVNVASPASATSPFKVYRWDTEASAPVVVYSGVPLTGARLGDSFDVIGSGNNVRMVAGYSNSPAVTGNTGYAVFNVDSTNANNFLSTHYAFGAPNTVAGNFRLGLTFTSSRDSIMGTQGSTGGRLTSIAGGVGSFVSNQTLSSASERHMDFTVIDGVKVLATMDSISSLARIYDMTNESAPALLASVDLTGTDLSNGDGTGNLAWGAVSGKNATLYGVNTNNGVFAYNVTVVPEPATMTALALGLAAVARRRKQK